MIDLPSDWPLTIESLQNPDNSWPIEWLRKLAKYPHVHEICYGEYMVVSNDDPPKPFAPGTSQCAMLVAIGSVADEELITSDGHRILFYQLGPLYREERDLCLEQGLDVLVSLFDDVMLKTTVDMRRVNVAV